MIFHSTATISYFFFFFVSPDNKPVILVLMHHTREAKYTSSVKTWLPDGRDVFPVDVFYHETTNGLLRCDQNNQAVFKIGAELRKHTSTKHSVSADTEVERSLYNAPSIFPNWLSKLTK